MILYTQIIAVTYIHTHFFTLSLSGGGNDDTLIATISIVSVVFVRCCHRMSAEPMWWLSDKQVEHNKKKENDEEENIE